MGWAAPVKPTTDIQQGFRRLSREISRLKAKVRSAHDLQIAAQTRAHDLKLRAKTAEYSLRGLCQREQTLKANLETLDLALSLTRTEIVGHLKIEDDLQARIAELEKALKLIIESPGGGPAKRIAAMALDRA
jgi:chromosome segregation ATPase